MEGLTHQAMPRIGDRIDRYEICGEVDSGGMSVVYAVKRVGGVGGWSKLLAMKVILPNLARQERFATMFMDEARIMSLIQHPNVVQVHDIGQTDAGLLFMVMELLRGRSLSRLIREALRTDGMLDRAIMLAILADAAEGLHAAHETRTAEGQPAKIVHRDVSPQNIHIGFDGTVKVLDFGIAAAEGRRTETRTGELKGKLSYIAPEQILRHPTDRRADVWSLGVMAWELLVGRRLFTGENEIETLRNVDAMEVPPIALVARGLPVRTADVIMKSLTRDREQRPATAGLVASALREGARALGAGMAEGGDALSDRRAYVQRLLGTEMVIENERLAASVRQGPPPPVRGLSPEEEISDPFRLAIVDETHAGASASARRKRMAIAASAAGVALLAGLGTWALVRGANATDTPSLRGDPAHTPATRPATPIAERLTRDGGADIVPAPPPAEPRLVELVVDPRFRTVRVDGQVVTERPVLVAVAATPVVIQALGPAGERVERVLGPDTPERVSLSLPRVGTPRRDPPPQHDKKTPLLDNPYHRRSP